MPTSRVPRLLVLALVAALLVGSAGAWFARSRDTGAAAVVDSSAGTGWQTIEYRGVRVDLPDAWARADLGGCEFTFERWVPPGSDPCGSGAGVAFYASATFDPADPPGTHRARSTTHEAPAWQGYVVARDVAVFVADDDRGVVDRMLGSVRAGG